MRLRYYSEEFPPPRKQRINNVRHHSVYGSPSFYPEQPQEYAKYFARSVSYDTYNDLVKPQPLRLGQETPDCSQIIFNGDRNYQHLLLPKCKKKKKKNSSGKSQFIRRHFAKKNKQYEREMRPPDPSPPYLEPSVEIRNNFVSYSDEFPYENKKSYENNPPYENNLPYENNPPYENNLPYENNSPYGEDLPWRGKRVIEYEMEEETLHDGLRRAHFEFKDLEWWCDENNEKSNEQKITNKIHNFLAYYSMLCGQNLEIDLNCMKELIIRVMYRKVFVMTYVKSVLQSNTCTTDGEREVGGGQHGKKGMVINLPWADHSNQANESDDTPVAFVSSRYKEHNCVGNISRIFFSSSSVVNFDTLLSDVNEDDYFDSIPSSVNECNESESYEAGGGRREKYNVRQQAWSDQRSSVLARPSSRAHSVEFSDDSEHFSDQSDCLDEVHRCHSDCEMPCKTSGIPVYRGRTGLSNNKLYSPSDASSNGLRVKGNENITSGKQALVRSASAAANNNGIPSPVKRTSISNNRVKSCSQLPKTKQFSPANENKRKESSNGPPTIARKSKLESKPPASPSLKKSTRVAKKNRNSTDKIANHSPPVQQTVSSSNKIIQNPIRQANKEINPSPLRRNKLSETSTTSKSPNVGRKSDTRGGKSNSSLCNKEQVSISSNKLSSSDESFASVEKVGVKKCLRSKDSIVNRVMSGKRANALRSRTNLNRNHSRGNIIKGDDSNDSRCSTPTSVESNSPANTISRKAPKSSVNRRTANNIMKAKQMTSTTNNARALKQSPNIQNTPKRNGPCATFDKKVSNSKVLESSKGSSRNFDSNKAKNASRNKENSLGSKVKRKSERNCRTTLTVHSSKQDLKLTTVESCTVETSRPAPKHAPSEESSAHEVTDQNVNCNRKNLLIESLVVSIKNEMAKQNNNLELGNDNINTSNLSRVIDASLLNDLKINGEILSDQFDAIITTLKKVAQSMDFDWDITDLSKDCKFKLENEENTINQAQEKSVKFGRSISLNNRLNTFNSSDSDSCEELSRKLSLQTNSIANENHRPGSNFSKNRFRKVNSDLYIAPNQRRINRNNQMSRMRNLTKSRELLNHLEKEYRLLKGEDSFSESGHSLLNFEAKNFVKKLDRVLHPTLDWQRYRIENEELQKSPSTCSSSSATSAKLISNGNHKDIPLGVSYKELTLRKMGILPNNYGAPRPSGIVDPSDSSEEGMHIRSMSLPKSFLSDRFGIKKTKRAPPGVIFPWRLGENGTENTKGNSCNLLDQSQQTKENLNSSFAQQPNDAIKSVRYQPEGSVDIAGPEESHASNGFTRTSISHSEWDIRSSWPPESGCSHSQSVCRLEEVRVDENPSHVERLQEAPFSMPYIMPPATNASNNASEGMFQKFKKSLSLRLNKKGSRSESPVIYNQSSREENQEHPHHDVIVASPKIKMEEDMKSNHFKFGHPIFRSSKERKRAKLRDVRSTKCNSGDSGDSGIEVISGTGTLVGENNFPTATQHENHYVTYLGNINHQQDENKKFVHRTQSDMKPILKATDSVHRQSLGRQYSSPQPIKMRPLHRLPNYNSVNSMQKHQRIRRSKASTHLRRSVSQPLDLDKSFQAQVSLMKIRINNDTTPMNRQRRPSVDNLLSDDDSSEDEGALSDGEEFRTDFKLYLDEEEEGIVYAEALWDHVSLDNDELVFKAGDLITVVDSSDRDWWWGKISNRSGWFPASFVRLLVNQEDHQEKGELDGGEESFSDRKLSLSSLSYDQIRSNVINEILTTERDYVKHLRDVVEGYLRQVRKRPDMFSHESIVSIFGNMEELYIFHKQFLNQLEKYIEYDEPHRSCIGECFIQNKSRFEIYSEYCNNHPSAVSELQQLYENQKYVHFFEACRLLQEMIDISLDGFLLTPVQKICKYPLQLQELLKYTRPNHDDFPSVQGAMQAMKEVALLVNERRRRMECLEKIATWQRAVEGWEGPELLDDSSQLIHQGEVTKGVGGSWPKEVTLFLFDHQIIYCKRDLLKRTTFVYRGRINTDLCDFIDIPDDPLRSVTFHNAWKIHSLDKNKTYVFTCKTAAEKMKWLNSFKKERDMVVLDEVSGFVVSEKQKQVARISARNHKCRPKKPKTPKSHKRGHAMTYAQAKVLVNDIHSNSLPGRGNESKKKGLWFSFGANKKGRNSKLSLQI